tara:strand:- start:911 stop:1198 length:288 start_codon:yes stop_codon:yes gene_type:complete
LHSSSSGTDLSQATPAAEATRQASLPPTLVVEEIEHGVRHHLVEQLDLNENHEHLGAFFLFLFTFKKKRSAQVSHTPADQASRPQQLTCTYCNQR